MPRETSFVSRPAQDVSEKRATCATSATREDEVSDSSRFSRQSRESRTKNEIRFPVRSFDGSMSSPSDATELVAGRAKPRDRLKVRLDRLRPVESLWVERQAQTSILSRGPRGRPSQVEERITANQCRLNLSHHHDDRSKAVEAVWCVSGGGKRQFR